MVPISMMKVHTLSQWKTYFDGVRNSRGSRVGIVIFTPTKGLIGKYLYITFQVTNNVVEYKALLLALHQLKSLGDKRVLVTLTHDL